MAGPNIPISPTVDQMNCFLRYLRSQRIFERSALNKNLPKMRDRYVTRKFLLQNRLHNATVTVVLLSQILSFQNCEYTACDKARRLCNCRGCFCNSLRDRERDECRDRTAVSEQLRKCMELLHAMCGAIQERTDKGLTCY